MAIKAVLFDKDDTLIDLSTFWQKPVEQLAIFIARSCKQEENAELIEKLKSASGFDGSVLRTDSPVVWGTNRDVVCACVRVLSESGISADYEAAETWARYLEYACIQYGSVVGKADFKTLLPTLKKDGLKLGVATSDQYSVTMHCLESLGIDGYFAQVLAADQVKRAKPAPDMAEIFCRCCDVRPEEVIMVGDSENDMRFAKNSGMIGAYFSSAEPHNKPEGAALVLNDLQELPGCIRAFNGQCD